MWSPISNSSTLREKRRQGLSPPEESSRRFSSGAVGETGSGRIAPSTAMAGKTTLSMRRTEAHRDAGDLRIHARRGAFARRSGTDPLQITELTVRARLVALVRASVRVPTEQERQRPLYNLRFAAS